MFIDERERERVVKHIYVFQEVHNPTIYRLIHWDCSGQDVTKVYAQLLDRVELLGGKRLGKHKIHCRMSSRKNLMPGYASQKMYMLRMTKNVGVPQTKAASTSPASSQVYTVVQNERSVVVVDSNSNSNHRPTTHAHHHAHSSAECPLAPTLVLACGVEGALILNTLDIYQLKWDAVLEGQQYEIGDFYVALGMPKTRDSSPKGLILELTYRASGNPRATEQLLNEFQQLLGLQGSSAAAVVPHWKSLYEQAQLSLSQYTMQHSGRSS